MGRLIDADVLIEEYSQASGLKLVVENAPTAYDVEKVVEELEDEKNKRIQNILLNSQSDFIDQEITREETLFDKVIEIVRKGGVE